jgi:hypothetical protein
MRTLVAAGVLAVALAAAVPAAEAYEQRKGSLTVGLFGSYEGIEGGGEYGDDFDLGPGYGVRLRYAMSREAAVGLVFERLTFESVLGSMPGPDSLLAPPDRLILIVTGGEYVRHFDRRGKLGKSLFGGAGFYHPTIEISRNEQQTANGDNLLAWAGAGLEYFPRRTIGVELGVRAFGILAEGGASGVAQASLGVNLYLLK